jgi:hypothetical protein
MITPADGPSAPSQYAAMPVQSADIQAPQADLSADAAAAVSETMARQPAAERLLTSPQGYGEFSLTAGFSGGDGPDGWPASVEPGG